MKKKLKKVHRHKRPIQTNDFPYDAGRIVKKKAIFGALFFVFSLFFFISLLQNPQEMRQRAQPTSPTPSPSTTPQPPQCAALNGTCMSTGTCSKDKGIDAGAQDCGSGLTCCSLYKH